MLLLHTLSIKIDRQTKRIDITNSIMTALKDTNKNRLEVWRKNKKLGSRTGMTYRELAKQIGVSDAAVARRYCLPLDHKDFSRPADHIMQNIIMLTMGEVGIPDFYNLDVNFEKENAEEHTS